MTRRAGQPAAGVAHGRDIVIRAEQSGRVGDQSSPVLFGRDRGSRRGDGLRAPLAVEGEAEDERTNRASADNGGQQSMPRQTHHQPNPLNDLTFDP